MKTYKHRSTGFYIGYDKSYANDVGLFFGFGGAEHSRAEKDKEFFDWLEKAVKKLKNERR